MGEAAPLTIQRIAIFPLPGAVLFPGLHLPLHIFEPRYKAMVQEVVPMYPQFRNPTGNPFPVKMRTRFHSILMTHFHSLTKAQPISPTATHFNRKT